MAALQQLLAHFHGVGDFRPGFDPRVMAMAIRAAINAMPAQLALGDLGPSRPVGAVRDRIVAYASFEPGPEDRPADSI